LLRLAKSFTHESSSSNRIDFDATGTKFELVQHGQIIAHGNLISTAPRAFA
jgi:hypothetical protein